MQYILYAASIKIIIRYTKKQEDIKQNQEKNQLKETITEITKIKNIYQHKQ